MLIDSLILIVGMMGLGLLSARQRLLPENAAETINRLVLDLCLPALVYQAVNRLQWDPSLIALVLLAWGLGALGWLLAHLLARRCGWSREITGCLALTVMLGNTAFLGYPMVSGLLGERALAAAVVYDQLGTFILTSTLGLTAAALYSGATKPTPKAILLKVLRFPAFLALLLALLPLPEPLWLGVFLDRVADLLVPLALFSVGLSFKLVPPREELAPLLSGLGLKMFLAPILAWSCLSMVDAPTHILAAGVLQSAMPPMVTAGAMAAQYGLAPRLAASLVGYGVLLALGWLPLLAWVLA